MNKHSEPTRPAAEQQVTLRSPGELADALPFLLGFHPTDSIVLVALHGDEGRFGGRLRLGIPRSPREWAPVAAQLAACLVEGSERRGSRPEGIVAFLCQDPEHGAAGRGVRDRLRPLAQEIRTSFGRLDIPVHEVLCVSGGRYWSYCCPDTRCCPPEGSPLALPGTSVMAAASAYAGIRVRGTLREMEARLEPRRDVAHRVTNQRQALDKAAATLVPLILGGGDRERIAASTLRTARELMDRLAGTRPAPARPDEGRRAAVGSDVSPDSADDRLITDDEAAAVIIGLQDRETRDRAARWMEGPDGEPALRLWQALARRCVGPYEEHAVAPLTLAGWVAWSCGDEPEARVALGLALRLDPTYTFALLLHQAFNEGLDPETLRRCLRGDEESATSPRPRARRRAATKRSTRKLTERAVERAVRKRADKKATVKKTAPGTVSSPRPRPSPQTARGPAAGRGGQRETTTGG
ncbi:DUF4192 domain-containing protein [Streptomyces sp. NBC_01498]|uniref:DUF4192 domain-containing protein n=1 Tax=Streptomyces sp. NBC_01498 TaxID=2975870 RepID=UPI002E7C3717|nr:DUF4192 domain-containing protein [Streptomyces sp. NBC_01498]WTL24267.1 DUF4192 domain-containing protein [Streptomyces sp. NBC_01498]